MFYKTIPTRQGLPKSMCAIFKTLSDGATVSVANDVLMGRVVGGHGTITMGGGTVVFRSK